MTIYDDVGLFLPILATPNVHMLGVAKPCITLGEISIHFLWSEANLNLHNPLLFQCYWQDLIKISHRNLHRSQLLSGIRWNSPSIWVFRQVVPILHVVVLMDPTYWARKVSTQNLLKKKNKMTKEKWVKDVETMKNHLPALMIWTPKKWKNFIPNMLPRLWRIVGHVLRWSGDFRGGEADVSPVSWDWLVKNEEKHGNS